MRFLAYTTKWKQGKVLLQESSGESVFSDNPDKLLDFMCEEYPDEKLLRVCWDLDATLAPLFRLMGKEACKILLKHRRLKFTPYHIFYVPGKIFSIKHTQQKKAMPYFNMCQYYPNTQQPEDIMEIEFQGRYLWENLNKMGLYSDTLTSPIRIFEKWVLDHCDLPTANDLPSDAGEMAWRCSGRLWIEAHKLGLFSKVWDYDLSSAFPIVASKLLDYRYGKWVNSREYHSDAYYGYARGTVTIKEGVKVSPIMYDDGKRLLCPTGRWLDVLTKGDIDFIKKYDIGKFEIKEGWWFIPHTRVVPLEHIINRLLKYKEQGGMIAFLAKRISVGALYGKFGEERDDGFGPHFNPVFFTEISTRTRLQVAEYIYDNNLQDNLISVGVDGFLLDKKINAGQQWKMAYTGKALAVSSGLMFLADKKPKGLYFDDVMKMINKHPNDSYYEQGIKRRVTLGDAIQNGKVEDVGDVKMMYSSIDLNTMEHDRYFAKLPRTGSQLLKKQYDSEPITIRGGR